MLDGGESDQEAWTWHLRCRWCQRLRLWSGLLFRLCLQRNRRRGARCRNTSENVPMARNCCTHLQDTEKPKNYIFCELRAAGRVLERRFITTMPAMSAIAAALIPPRSASRSSAGRRRRTRAASLSWNCRYLPRQTPSCFPAKAHRSPSRPSAGGPLRVALVLSAVDAGNVLCQLLVRTVRIPPRQLLI